ncbi:MAG: protein involved in polysaccharide export with SLBB domain [Saprospiraceae bacterium]|jgi:protein involved in polysaccharide export with SLBB domain
MKKAFLFFSLIFHMAYSQIPAGFDPSSISKGDLDSYGVSEGDLNRLLDEYSPTSSSEVVEKKVVEAKIVPDSKIVQQEKVTEAPKSTKAASVNSVYGRSLFDNDNLAVYANATHIKASPNYVLGTGDELSISIWGYSEHSGIYTIGNDGAIMPRLVGKIYLKGQTFEKAKKIVKSKFGKVYDLKNSQISIELNYSKVIRVNIVGEVIKPGTYTVPAINPAFNVLALAGGIRNSGTVREIQIKRRGKVVNEMDVYQFMKNPSYHGDFFLMDDDYLIVGAAKSIVTVSGAIKRPMKYELVGDEGIIDLVEFAGGFLPGSYTKRMNLYRYQNNQNEIIELNYDSLLKAKGNFKLQDGDSIDVASVPKEVRNTVNIDGAVKLPGEYALSPGMIVKDLIIAAEGVQRDAFLQKAFILRKEADFSNSRIAINILEELKGTKKTKLKEFDMLVIFSSTDFNDQEEVLIRGAVRKPGSFHYTKGLTLGDVIFLAGGVLPEVAINKVEISRIADYDNNSIEPVRVVVSEFKIEKDLLSKTNMQVPLMPNDIIFIRTLSNYHGQELASIIGEVKFPGEYVISKKGETVSELLVRAGGITDWAFVEGAFLQRNNDQGVQEFIVFDLKKLLKGSEEFDYVLKAGDRIVIPNHGSFVSLSGAVEFPKVRQHKSVQMPYHKGRTAKYYVNKYGGGFSKGAKRSRTYVETPGGNIKRTKNYLLFNIYPKVHKGDAIFVLNEKTKKKKDKVAEPVDWNRAIEKMTVKLTGLATLFIIMSTALSN